MRQVGVVRVTGRKIATTILGTMVATMAIQGIATAGQQAREVAVRTLGAEPPRPAPAPEPPPPPPPEPQAVSAPPPVPVPVPAPTNDHMPWTATGFVGA